MTGGAAPARVPRAPRDISTKPNGRNGTLTTLTLSRIRGTGGDADDRPRRTCPARPPFCGSSRAFFVFGLAQISRGAGAASGGRAPSPGASRARRLAALLPYQVLATRLGAACRNVRQENSSSRKISSCSLRRYPLNPPPPNRRGRSSGVEHNLAKVRVGRSNRLARSSSVKYPRMRA